MLTKENVISAINELPEPLDIDDVLEKIILLEKIQKGIEQSEKGQVIPDEELDQRLESWLV